MRTSPIGGEADRQTANAKAMSSTFRQMKILWKHKEETLSPEGEGCQGKPPGGIDT